MEVGDQFPGFFHSNDTGLASWTKVKEVGVLFLAFCHAKDILNQAIGLIVQGGQALSDAEDGVVQTTVEMAVD